MFGERGNAFGLISRSRRKEAFQDIIVVFKPEESQIMNVISLPEQSEPAWKMLYHKDKIYVSYYDSNSMKGNFVVVYDAKNYQPIKIMEGFNGPVDMLIEEGKLFILCNGNSNKVRGEVVVVDMEKMQVINKISVGKDPIKLAYIPKLIKN